tara:strand:+ start:400 stop:702 length:303 start_codon:yes stop_codon:yes gene_type:complete
MNDNSPNEKQKLDLIFKVITSVNNALELNNEVLDQKNLEQMSEVLEMVKFSMKTEIKMNYPTLNENSLSSLAIFSSFMSSHNISFNKEQLEKIKKYNKNI